MIAYKLLRVRRDGSLGPLFIGRRQRIPVGVRLPAEDIPTPGYAHRPGWHACERPEAPHLSTRGRAWFRVEIEDVTEHNRPARQGGRWFAARGRTVIGPVSP